jgi:hypothetical protein
VGDGDERVAGQPAFTLDCDECGFVYDETEHGEAAAAIVEGAGAIAAHVEGLDEEAAHRRPAPDTWSPVEYACHVRDVLLVQRERVLEARRSRTPPHPSPMGRDERVDHAGYADQAPHDAARQLRDAAALFALVLDRLDHDGWSRTLVYNYPEPWERSLRWVAVHTVHEVRHHRQDVERQLVTPS